MATATKELQGDSAIEQFRNLIQGLVARKEELQTEMGKIDEQLLEIASVSGEISGLPATKIRAKRQTNGTTTRTQGERKNKHTIPEHILLALGAGDVQGMTGNELAAQILKNGYVTENNLEKFKLSMNASGIHKLSSEGLIERNKKLPGREAYYQLTRSGKTALKQLQKDIETAAKS